MENDNFINCLSINYYETKVLFGDSQNQISLWNIYNEKENSLSNDNQKYVLYNRLYKGNE